MSIKLAFKSNALVFTRTRYVRQMSQFLDFFKQDDVEKLEYYFPKTSDSVYVLLQFKDKEHHLLFSIKTHKEFRPSSIKVFNTKQYFDLNHLRRSIGAYIDKAREGSVSLFNFKYGNYLGLNSIYEIANKGYQIVTSTDNYLNDLSGEIYIESRFDSKKRIEITDKVFLNRLQKLVFCGLTRGHQLENGSMRFYVTIFGRELFSQNDKLFKSAYLHESSKNVLEGLIEKTVS